MIAVATATVPRRGLITSTLTRKGQTTIPKAVRDQLGLEPGDRIEFVPDATGGVTLRRRRIYTLDDLAGCVPRPSRAATLEEIEEGIIRGAVDGEGDEP